MHVLARAHHPAVAAPDPPPAQTRPAIVSVGLRELVGEGRVEHFSAGGLPDEVTLGEVRAGPGAAPGHHAVRGS